MTQSNSYRETLRGTSLIGSASVIGIAIGMVRMKAAAVLLGPAGVGLVGLLTTMMGSFSTIASLGLGNAGTRQIADALARGDGSSIAAARRALFLGTMVLAVFGGVAFWLTSEFWAKYVFGAAGHALPLGWLSLGVALSVAAGSQSALLTGMRQIGRVSTLNVLSALLALGISVPAIWMFGIGGAVVFVIATPLASFILGHLFVANLPRHAAHITFHALVAQWKHLASLGFAVMLGGVVAALGQLFSRIIVQDQLGTDALGYFQAALTLSLAYVGLVLAAMSTDYFPRLSAVIAHNEAVNSMVNEQTEVALLLATPILLAIMGLAPWAIEWLYAASFKPAAEILRLQILGDLLKVASWPLGFVLLAAGAGRTFVLTETIGMGAFLVMIWGGLPVWGVEATGIAMICMYLIYLPMVYLIVRRRTGFAWSASVWRITITAATPLMSVYFLSRVSVPAAAVAGVTAAIFFGLYSFVHLARKADSLGRVGTMFTRTLEKLQAVRDKRN